MDAKDMFTSLTLDVIAKVAFACDVNPFEKKDPRFLYHAKEIFNAKTWKMFVVFLTTTWMKRLINFTPVTRKHATFFLDACRQMIRQKKAAVGQRNQGYTDFGDLMVEAKNEKGESLSEDEMVANAILFLVAGFETTATTITMASWVLSKNPQIQEKLYQEVTKCYESHGNRLDYEAVNGLSYLEAFIMEVLRMYPPVVRFDRICTEETTLENGIHIPIGTIMRFPVYSIHRNEEFYPKADSFNPDRFLPENKDQLIPYTFMPFVLGPRNCKCLCFPVLKQTY